MAEKHHEHGYGAKSVELDHAFLVCHDAVLFRLMPRRTRAVSCVAPDYSSQDLELSGLGRWNVIEMSRTTRGSALVHSG